MATTRHLARTLMSWSCSVSPVSNHAPGGPRRHPRSPTDGASGGARYPTDRDCPPSAPLQDTGDVTAAVEEIESRSQASRPYTDIAVCPSQNTAIVFRLPGDRTFESEVRAITRKHNVGLDFVDTRFSQAALTEALQQVFARSLALLEAGAKIEVTAQKNYEGGFIEIGVDAMPTRAREVLRDLGDRVRVEEVNGSPLVFSAPGRDR